MQTGHVGHVRSVAYSPDGKILVSGGDDNTITIWDVAKGQQLKTLKGHTGGVDSVAFSPDGQLIASGSRDNTIKLWNASSGQEMKTLVGHRGFSAFGVHSVTFSPDGRSLASGGLDNTIKLWDVDSGQELRTLTGHTKFVLSVAFSSDGKLLASASYDHTIKIWDAISGQELKTLVGHKDGVADVAFAPVGGMLASASYDRTIKLWDPTSGQERRSFDRPRSVNSIAFSSDGSTLACGGDDNSVTLLNLPSGRELTTFKGHTNFVTTVAFSPDGKTLASGGYDDTVKLWDAGSGKELLTFRGHAVPINSVAVSPDGRTIAGASWDHTIKLWGTDSGQDMRTLRGHKGLVEAVSFNPEGKILASGSDDKTIMLWDPASGRELQTLRGHSDTVYTVAFSPTDKILATGSRDFTIRLWDVDSGQELRSFKGHTNAVRSVVFSPDGKTLASGSEDNTVKLWDVITGKELKTLKGHSSSVYSVAFAPDGKTLATGGGIDPWTRSGNDSLKLWDVASGQELRSLPGHSSFVKTVAFSPDSRILESGSGDNTIKFWDARSGQELKTLKVHSSAVLSAAFTPNGRMLASGGNDATIKLWDVSSGASLGSLIALDENDWIVATPDGLFDGSPSAWNEINWRFSPNLYDLAPAEVFFTDFYYPGLLTDISAGKVPRASSDISKKDRRQPQLSIAMIGSESMTPTAVRNIKVRIDIVQATAGAQDLRLFRNGSLVKVWHGDVLKGLKSVPLEATIPVVAGENRLTAYAFNHDNVKSSDATLVINGSDSLKRKGKAYILAIGVNEYANREYNLAYAVDDAKDFAAELKVQQDKLGTYQPAEITFLPDAKATKSNILKALADLATVMKPEDSLTIFFAGHGKAQQNRFYLIPHDLGYTGSKDLLDAVGMQTIFAHSISDEEIEAAVERIDAGQLLLVIDACESGQVLKSDEERRGPMNSKGLAQLAYEKGMYILTASQSNQAAKESRELGHGFLTSALVDDGLRKGLADRDPKDGQILLREWLDYATERVPQMQQEDIVKRQLLRNGEKAGDKTRELDTMQRPRVFYRRETESHPMVIARP